ncbi:MAG: tyrosine-protein phosphatase [Chloroflexi bacterium]|nr:tyrosine-protein phosphatase [Chloroflexota bacterium]
MLISRIWPFSLAQKPMQIEPQQFIIEPPELATAVSHQSHYLLQWHIPSEMVKIYVGTAPDQINRASHYVCVTQQKEAVVAGLNTAVRYYFELAFIGGEHDGQRILVAERFLQFDGTVNFRDQGGYGTGDGRYLKWGRLYRSGMLGDLSVEDHAHLMRLGIQFVGDIRSEPEATRRPDKFDYPIEFHHWPIESLDKTSRLKTSWIVMFQRHKLSDLIKYGYTRFVLEDHAHVIGKLFHHLADANHLPAIIHCSAGKDRTGIVMALLMSVLGVPDDVIIADYTLSNRFYADYREMLRPDVRPLTRLGVSIDKLWPLLVVQADTLRYTFQYLRTNYGSIKSYLADRAGVDDAIIEQLKVNLLEPTS